MSEAVSAGRRILVELDRETPPGIRPVIGPVSGTAFLVFAFQSLR